MSTMDAAAPPASKAQLLRSRDDLKEWVAQAVGVGAEELSDNFINRAQLTTIQ